jgi:exosortase/archaeosortase family protein
MKTIDRIMFVAGLVLLFGGLNLAILLSHMSRLLGIAFIFGGIGLLLWSMRGEEAQVRKKTAKKENIASRLVNFLTLGGRLRPLIPVAGIAVLVMIISYNLLLANDFYLGSNDYVALVLAMVLLVYNFIPEKYYVERDFALLFSIFLFIFLVIPTTLLSLGGGETDTNTPLTYYLLAMPTAALTRLLGISVISPFNPEPGVYVYNMMLITGSDGYPINLSIGLSCTGLYSVAIFVSAFIAFVAVEYKKADSKVALLLSLGIFLAWFANILRMTIIVIVGKYYGAEAMVWTHNNIGELIFMAWITMFWLFMFRYFRVLDDAVPDIKIRKSKGGKCEICSERLSPAIPSRKCKCGSVSHTECIRSKGDRCPSCGGTFGTDVSEKD